MHGDSRRVVWIEAELIGGHMHLDVHTGKQYGQPDIPTMGHGTRGWRNDLGGAGKLCLREEQWLSFIQALAMGGHATGLRVLWRVMPWDRRILWNGCPAAPCLIGERQPVPWEQRIDA